MDSSERIKTLTNHLEEHPADYQARIALLKAKSNAFEYERKQKVIKKQKLIAKCKKMREEQNVGK